MLLRHLHQAVSKVLQHESQQKMHLSATNGFLVSADHADSKKVPTISCWQLLALLLHLRTIRPLLFLDE
jgi:hypothetical protein